MELSKSDYSKNQESNSDFSINSSNQTKFHFGYRCIHGNFQH